LTIRILSSSWRRSVCDHSFADRIRPWWSGWTGQDPDAICGEDRVECPGKPRIPVSEQEVNGGDTIAEVHQQVPGSLGGPCTSRVRRHPDQMSPAGTVLDCDQRVDPGDKHGAHVHEIHGQDGLGLRGEELAPGRTRPARRGIDTGVMQDLPHGRGGDPMAEPDQLALHPPMSPRGVLVCHPHHQLLDRRSGRGTSRWRRAV
jgi:hypothetical protein